MLAEAEVEQRIEVEQGLAIPGAWPTDVRAEDSGASSDGFLDSLKTWRRFHKALIQGIAHPESGREKNSGSQVNDEDAINPDMQLALDLAISQVRDEASIIGRDKRID